jgi:alpha-mannosidase
MKKVLRQVALPEESETLILLDYFERKLKIYTSKAAVMRRMEKAGHPYIKQDIVDGEIYSRSYEFPSKELSKFLRTSLFKYD